MAIPKDDRRTDLVEVARGAMKTALAKGAQEAAAYAYRVREVSVEWRDGKVDKINESTTRGVAAYLYVDGRYAVVSSSDLRPEALAAFLSDSVAMTRTLTKDPHRRLPDPALYAGQAQLDLQLEDAQYATVTPERRRAVAREIEEGARAVKGADAILSVTTEFADTRTESARVHSNGFEGARSETSFGIGAQVSVKDADGRRPEDYSYARVRFVGEAPMAAGEGRKAAERALGRIGAKKGDSAVLTMLIDPRAAGKIVTALVAPLSGQALQQKRSFLEGKVGTAIGSAKLTLVDDPHVPKGLGSRLYDGEGLAARKLPIFEAGVLKNYYIDTSYGRKLDLPPTTSAASNLTFALGDKPLSELLSELKDGILVTSFLGGNSNSTTGDFSFGVSGFRVRGGQVAEPVSEMNVAGNLADLLNRLVAVGNDPYPYSNLRTPTLVFEGVQFAGN